MRGQVRARHAAIPFHVAERGVAPDVEQAANALPAAADLLSQAEKYLATAQSLIKNGDPKAALQQLSLASAAADDAKMTANQANNVAKIKDLDAQIADLKTKLGK